MSKIIEIKECGPNCPRFRPYGSIDRQQGTADEALCFNESTCCNFWLENPTHRIHGLDKAKNEKPCKKAFLTIKNAKVL
jgi:hypothetical protein